MLSSGIFLNFRAVMCNLKVRCLLLSVCLEVGNFPHYGDFEGLIGKKNNGEFPTQKLGNLALSRLCDTFYSKYYIFAIKHLNMSYFQTYDTLYEIFCVPR